jgi:Z1 domain-containing protein
MTKKDGQYFTATMKALRLPADQEEDARINAENIVGKILAAYEENVAPGHVGAEGSGIPSGFTGSGINPHLLTGLVYGRIQSGKTRAMIASTAMAFDNAFRIVVVLTSNINDLVNQTHFDFASGLPDVMVFTKDDELVGEIENAKLDLAAGDGRMLIVCSKGATSLKNVITFLKQVDAKRYPAIIFDDEGDQASLDTNTRKRSISDVAVAPSSINKLIQEKLRSLMPCHVYVSVTGTPQAVLLQSAGSRNTPSFIEPLPPGESYVGGDHFFADDEPEDNHDELIRIVDSDEKDKLLGQAAIPSGLRRAILFYLLSAAAAIENMGFPEHKNGYSFLCHPSLKNDEQAVAATRISSYLGVVKATLLEATGADPKVLQEFSQQYEDLKKTLGAKTPSFEVLSKRIVASLRTRKILVINAKAKRQGIAYGPGLNFLIGGNTLGRGIAIRDLLVTYYLRDSRISQIDTMHQHARMFGYRLKTLPYTRLFVPRRLYYRFRDIHRSDQDLRRYVEEHKDVPKTFPIEFTFDLRTTRPGVLDVNTTDTLRPGMQVYPNYVVVPQNPAAYSKLMAKLNSRFGPAGPSMEEKGKKGVTISVDEAVDLVQLIKTKSENTWRDKTIDAVIRKVAGKFGNKVTLRFRSADRLVREEGFMSTGTLSGDEYHNAGEESIPTLWIMSVESAEGSFCGKGKRFMYPTFVIPNGLPKLLMFNRG